MLIKLEDNERDCSNYFHSASKDYIQAKNAIKAFYEGLQFTVFEAIGYMLPTRQKVSGISNLLAKRTYTDTAGALVIDTRAIMIHFPHRPFATKNLLKRVQRLLTNWPDTAIFLCYRKTGKRKGTFPTITKRLASNFNQLIIYSFELSSLEFRLLYNGLNLDNEVISIANPNNRKQEGS